MLSTKLWGEGTIGISGVRGEEEGYEWWVNWALFYINSKGVDRVMGVLTSGYKNKRVQARGMVGWIRFKYWWASWA